MAFLHSLDSLTSLCNPSSRQRHRGTVFIGCADGPVMESPEWKEAIDCFAEEDINDFGWKRVLQNQKSKQEKIQETRCEYLIISSVFSDVSNSSGSPPS